VDRKVRATHTKGDGAHPSVFQTACDVGGCAARATVASWYTRVRQCHVALTHRRTSSWRALAAPLPTREARSLPPSEWNVPQRRSTVPGFVGGRTRCPPR